jgi:tripartite-type tricarboxylate transporter receptor subunit TctC
MIGADGVIKSPPDGYSLLYTSSALAINQVLYPERKLNVLRDFQPVTNSTTTQGSLVTINASYPVKDLKDFIALARAQAKEGKPLAYGSPGVGNGIHLTTELFAMRTGIQLLHVPHPGIPQILQSIAQGNVALLITQGAALEPLIKAGRLRALAVTGAERNAAAPDAPTLAELGVPGFPIPGSWSGFYAPARTPMDVVMKFQGQVRAALDAPKVKERLAATGNVPVGNTPEQFARLIASETERYAEVVRVANIKAE